jgi:hypothetical protein
MPRNEGFQVQATAFQLRTGVIEELLGQGRRAQPYPEGDAI